MEDQKQTQQNQEKDKSQPQASSQRSDTTAPRRILGKRWMYPAIYLGAAALIIGLMYLKTQTGSTSPVTSSAVDEGQPASGQTAVLKWQWPADPAAHAQVSLGFFPEKGTPQQQAATLVSYDNGYYPHQGLDIKAASGQAFTVLAAADGKVTHVYADANNPATQFKGQMVVVTSPGGYEEHYESLSAVKVKEGDTVTAGQPIGTSGTCDFEKSQGNHLFFAVYK
ncbi:MAG: M23 family metallopeptidase, partial [Alicyclobacillus sp.]|nr:M23 family metallopeptidase [Alicyclobacillus sp.]